MINLTHFAWSGDVPATAAHEDAVLEVLTRKSKLKHLFLAGEWGRHARGTHQDPDSDVYPVRLPFPFMHDLSDAFLLALEDQRPCYSHATWH